MPALTTYATAQKASSKASPNTCNSRLLLLVLLYHPYTALGLFCENSKVQLSRTFSILFSIGWSLCSLWFWQTCFMINIPLFENGTMKPIVSNIVDTFDKSCFCQLPLKIGKKSHDKLSSPQLPTAIATPRLWVYFPEALNISTHPSLLKPIWSSWNFLSWAVSAIHPTMSLLCWQGELKLINHRFKNMREPFCWPPESRPWFLLPTVEEQNWRTSMMRSLRRIVCTTALFVSIHHLLSIEIEDCFCHLLLLSPGGSLFQCLLITLLVSAGI